MIYTQYKKLRITEEQQDKIETAHEIIKDYADQGYDLTLRQLYYKFVSKGLIPNKQTEYENLGYTLSRGRLAGLLPWDRIVDRTRHANSNAQWNDPEDRVRSAAETYGIDLWADQPERVEVWIEKEALIGVISNVCRQNDVTHFACRGYVSQSEMWRASQRLLSYEVNGQRTHIIHLGDHDPSGIDMTRDIQDRLNVFMGEASSLVHRVALNMDQIKHFNPPPNPTKLGDSRSKGYVKEYGDKSWELDALEPAFIVQLIQRMINHFRKVGKWNAMNKRESAERARLHLVADRWVDVEKFVSKKQPRRKK